MKCTACAVAVLASTLAAATTATITVHADKRGARIPKSLYGIFLEEINNAGEGGLYAELIQNRSFEDANLPPSCSLENGFIVPPRTPHFWSKKPSDWKMPWRVESAYPAWTIQGKGTATVVTDKPLNAANPHSLKVVANGETEIVNGGFWGVNIQKGEPYNLTLYTRSENYKGSIKVELCSTTGKVLAQHVFKEAPGQIWKKKEASFTAVDTDPKAKFVIVLDSPGTVYFDHISLFPEFTYKRRPNGLRQDLAQMIADLKPAFIRFPGGCVTEGITIESRPRWEETLGPVEARVPTFSPWGYWNTNGFGYHEWLQFCEDIDADALYVFSAGISCAFRSGTYLPKEELPGLIQNTLDAIEYAVGPATSKWGSKRAKNGRPKPFPLKYVEIGNEDQGPEYGERVKMFYTAIKARYPQIKIILSSWISGIDQPAIEAAGKIDIVDEHAYTPAGWAVTNFDSFSKYPRKTGWELYIGEFAANSGVGRGNMLATINDAAYMMSMEKNSDLVKMGSYAPLLENTSRRQWEVNLIHFDGSRAYGRASYYACKLFAENRPDINVATEVQVDQVTPPPIEGGIGVGSFATAAEFKEIVVSGQTIQPAAFKTASGEWSVEADAYRQSSREAREIWSFAGAGYRDLKLTLKARKIAGAEGFLVSVGNVDGSRVQVNFGGWGNTLHAVQVNSASPVAQTRGRIEEGRWYDVKVEITGRSVRAYLDDKLVVQHTFPPPRPLLVIAGRDEKTGELIVKVLNTTAEPIATSLSFTGASPRSGTKTVLAAKSLQDENSYEEPQKIVPKTEKLENVKTHTFMPNSLTILRLKAAQ